MISQGHIEPLGLGFDDLGPRRVYVFHDPAQFLRAAVVVDTLRRAPSGGGVRMQADLKLADVARLARAMTYKYALLSMPVGGAKAGIWLDPTDPRREVVLDAFRRAIGPLGAAGLFVPGPDMGTRATDFGDALLPGPAIADERLTGAGVVAAAAAALARSRRTLDGARVAIEGFGKVGSAAAELFARDGARVVAISTVRGALHDPDGLDVACLVAARSAYGDALVERVDHARRIPRESLLVIPCDVLVPAAGPDVMDVRTAADLGATLIVPGANIPYAEGALEVLAARGVLALPDVVTSAGGVLGVVCAIQGLDTEPALATVRSTIAANVDRVLDRAEARGELPQEAAIALAREHLASDDASS